MSFNECQFKHSGPSRYARLSNEGVILFFSNGDSWIIPDVILHYIADHNWYPPQDFIYDVMNLTVTNYTRMRLKGMQNLICISLYNDFKKGQVPDDFIGKLEVLMEQTGTSIVYNLGGNQTDKSSQVIKKQPYSWEVIKFHYDGEHYFIDRYCPNEIIVLPDKRILKITKWSSEDYHFRQPTDVVKLISPFKDSLSAEEICHCINGNLATKAE